MEELELIKEKKILSQLEGILSPSDVANFLFEHNIGIIIILYYIKAKEWPWKGEPLVNEPVEKIPIIWAVFNAIDNKHIKMIYDIHPTKCFPQRYNRYNPNAENNSMQLTKGWGGTLAGCRKFVKISDRIYDVFEKTPEYCSIFGIPDDCYDPEFEKRMVSALTHYKELELWCFEKTEYVREKLEPAISFHYMKGEFLPSKHFLYKDTIDHFLKGIFRASELDGLNSELWYLSSKEFIEEMNLNNSDFCFRFEEEAIYYIKKRLIYEFTRLFLLLKNRDSFSSFVSSGPSRLDLYKETKVQVNLEHSVNKIISETNSYLNSVMNTIGRCIDTRAFKSLRFMVVDAEYVHVLYPKENERTFNFPCIFSSILWLGARDGFKTNVNVFILPCHFCDLDCLDFKNKRIKFDCLAYGHEFIDKQISMVEELFTRYEGFKIYSYGRSDVFQLEQAGHFFSDSFEIHRYERRNRKRLQRIVDVSEDLSMSEKSLLDIENEILKRWLVGWSREKEKFNVNNRFMIRFDSPRWENSYNEAINSCIGDALSAFLYLIYKKYRVNDNSIAFLKPTNILNFE